MHKLTAGMIGIAICLVGRTGFTADAENVFNLDHLTKSCRAMAAANEMNFNEIPGNTSAEVAGRIMGSLAYCSGYLSGVAEGLSASSNVAERVCISKDSVSMYQIAKVFLKWVDSHPEKLHWHRYEAAKTALLEAFACSK